MEIKTTDRSMAARDRRYREFMGLRTLPFRNKEQEGRFQWLAKERVKDNHAAMKEGK